MSSHDGDSGLAAAAGRAALFPARAAARAWRGEVEAVADDLISTPEFARVIDRALAGPLPEEVARSLVRHRVLERVVADLAASGQLERMVNAALASDEMHLALGKIASSPELREAVKHQSAGFAEEVLDGARASSRRLDDKIDRVKAPSAYGGIVTRALALGVDAILVTVVYEIVVGIGAVIASLAGGVHPAWLAATLLAFGWILFAAGYFIGFWSTAGVTPGMRLLRLRVQTGAGATPSAARSAVRLVGLVLSIIPLFLGFVPALFDRRRRGLADFLAGTTVVYDEPPVS